MKELIAYLKSLIVEAGELLLSQTVLVSKHKTANDLLTENDLLIERFLIDGVKGKFPSVNIVSEETAADNALQGVSVVIDPIDGTCNYAVGTDRFGVQAAVFDGEECVASMLYFPVQKELVTAEKGKGAFLGEKRLAVDTAKRSGDGVLLISDYYSGQDVPMEKQFALVQALQTTFLKTRHLGAACVDFVSLARGQAVAYICHYHHIWDIAPGLLAATESGCVYAHLSGREYRYGEPALAVANSEETLKKVLKTYEKL